MTKNNLIELTLKANTESAKKNINSFTTSLNNLSKVAKTVGGLSIFGITAWKVLT